MPTRDGAVSTTTESEREYYIVHTWGGTRMHLSTSDTPRRALCGARTFPGSYLYDEERDDDIVTCAKCLHSYDLQMEARPA